MEGTRPLRGQPYPTFKCSQYFKVKVKVKINVFISAKANAVLTFTF
jgi:hypothetical protein